MHFLNSILSSEIALKSCFIFVYFWIVFFGIFDFFVSDSAPKTDSESEPLFECGNCAAHPLPPRAMGKPSDYATKPNRLQPMFQCRCDGTAVTDYCAQYAHFASASNRVTMTRTRPLHAFSKLRTHAAPCSHSAVNSTLLARAPQPRSRPMREARW